MLSESVPVEAILMTEESDSLTIERTLALKKRFVRGEEVELIPETFEQIERALQLVLASDPSRV